MCDAGPMAQTVCVIVSAADRERLQAIIGDRNQSRKHMERARIVLASAEREPAQRVAAGVGLLALSRSQRVARRPAGRR